MFTQLPRYWHCEILVKHGKFQPRSSAFPSTEQLRPLGDAQDGNLTSCHLLNTHLSNGSHPNPSVNREVFLALLGFKVNMGHMFVCSNQYGNWRHANSVQAPDFEPYHSWNTQDSFPWRFHSCISFCCSGHSMICRVLHLLFFEDREEYKYKVGTSLHIPSPDITKVEA